MDYILTFISFFVWFMVIAVSIIKAVKKSKTRPASSRVADRIRQESGDRQRQSYQRQSGQRQKSDPWAGVKHLQNANPDAPQNKNRDSHGDGRRIANAARSFKPKNPARTELKFGGLFQNTGYDDYSSIGSASGYNRDIFDDKNAMANAFRVQYSHTYDGHEPWDKCLPREKDPWEDGFYSGK